MSAPIHVLSPGLTAWCRDAGAADHTVAIVRLGIGADATRAAAELESLGFDVTRALPGTIVGNASPATLHQVAGEPWVMAIEEPTELTL